MNEHELLAKLAGAARRDLPPDIDVSQRVLQDIAFLRPRRAFDPVLGYFALAACLAAAVTVALAVGSWLRMQDPLLVLANSVTTVI
jgi:hypothetical protein